MVEQVATPRVIQSVSVARIGLQQGSCERELCLSCHPETEADQAVAFSELLRFRASWAVV